jgi:diacylglycerol kinase family enzyme
MPRPTALRPASHHRRLLVSASPRAGARSRRATVDEIVTQLEGAGYLVRATEEIDELERLAADWQAAGELRAVLACGGDGTASLVRNVVPLEIPLLAVPMGTENLLSRYLSQSATPASVLQTVEEGVAVGLDLGLVKSSGRCVGSTPTVDRYFLMMISAGFDAEVVRRLHDRRRGHVTRASYVQPTLQTIRSYQYPELRLYCGDDGWERVEPIYCRWAFAFNLPVYACGWQIAPDAVGTDSQFDICTFRRGSFLHTARYLWHVVRRNHFYLADTQQLRNKRFRIEAGDGDEVAYQLDGDSGGVLPVDVDLLPGELRLLVMPEVATRLGFSVDAPR